MITTLSNQQTLFPLLQRWREQQQTIAFVPTMGNLHKGHLQLVKVAKEHGDKIIVSIFVNPLQFGPNEDLDTYPRTFSADKEKLEKEKTDLIFFPSVADIYPNIDNPKYIEVPKLGGERIDNQLCGETRPVFFRGICTVVEKLFHLIKPNVALFGEKDLQQFRIIQQLTKNLKIPTNIISVPTVREKDGLAYSSRNNYLTPQDRGKAPLLYKVLQQTKEKILNSDRNYEQLSQHALAILEKAGFKTDYFSFRNYGNLLPAKKNDTDIACLAAAYLGKTRLIDNIRINLR